MAAINYYHGSDFSRLSWVFFPRSPRLERKSARIWLDLRSRMIWLGVSTAANMPRLLRGIFAVVQPAVAVEKPSHISLLRNSSHILLCSKIIWKICFKNLENSLKFASCVSKSPKHKSRETKTYESLSPVTEVKSETFPLFKK